MTHWNIGSATLGGPPPVPLARRSSGAVLGTPVTNARTAPATC